MNSSANSLFSWFYIWINVANRFDTHFDLFWLVDNVFDFIHKLLFSVFIDFSDSIGMNNFSVEPAITKVGWREYHDCLEISFFSWIVFQNVCLKTWSYCCVCRFSSY
jgi:hypothetical protein